MFPCAPDKSLVYKALLHTSFHSLLVLSSIFLVQLSCHGICWGVGVWIT